MLAEILPAAGSHQARALQGPPALIVVQVAHARLHVSGGTAHAHSRRGRPDGLQVLRLLSLLRLLGLLRLLKQLLLRVAKHHAHRLGVRECLHLLLLLHLLRHLLHLRGGGAGPGRGRGVGAWAW
jgi:hypothetical protein